MSCKLALQIFRNNVSSAIKTTIYTSQLKSKTNKVLIFYLNNVFQNLYDKNSNRRPMSSRNKHVFENINKTILIFQNAIKISQKKQHFNRYCQFLQDCVVNNCSKTIIQNRKIYSRKHIYVKLENIFFEQTDLTKVLWKICFQL